MKEPGPVICRRTVAHKLAQQGERPSPCGRCSNPVVSRSNLIGWEDGQPLCGNCLMEAAPGLGWAWRLVEAGTLALGAGVGRAGWPATVTSRAGEILLGLVEGLTAALGPFRGGGNDRAALALELLDVFGRHQARRQPYRRAEGRRVASRRLAAIRELLMEEIERQGLDLVPSDELPFSEFFEVLGRLDIAPGEFFAKLWAPGRER